MEELSSRDEAYGYADRFDEKYEMLRSVRKGKWKYIRSFQPFYPDALHNNYRYQMLAFAEWRSMFQEGLLSGEEAQFFLGKQVEMLFDLDDDPHEVNNLAENPAYTETLVTLRELATTKAIAIHDLSFFPESVMVAEAMDNPVAFGKANRDRLMSLIETANLALDPSPSATAAVKSALSDSDALVRYWAVTAQTARPYDPAFRSIIPGLKSDSDLLVRWRAIEYLGLHEREDPMRGLVQLINESRDPVEVLQVMNSLVFFRDHPAFDYTVNPRDINPLSVNDEVKRRIAYFADSW